MSLWFYQDTQGVQLGPLTDDAFRDLRECGRVRDTTLIWRTGWTDWTTYAEIWLRGDPPQETNVAAGLAIEAAPIPPPRRLAQPVQEDQPQAITYATCSACSQKWPEHLLFGSPRLYMCAACLKAHEEKRKDRQRLRDRGYGMNTGLFIWLFRVLILGLIMGGAIVFFFNFLKAAAK
jgi:hypothetical protein